MTWRLTEQVASELVRILPRCRSHLVDERLDDEALERGANRSPESERDAGIVLGVLDADIRDVVREVGRTVDRDEVDTVRRQPTDSLHQRLLHDVLLEDGRLA